MEDDLERIRRQFTVPVPLAGRVLANLSPSAAYDAARTGRLAGIEVIRIGRKMAVPCAPIRRKLGLNDNGASGEAA
ncbi:hypothetical protein [Methylobacterium nodulans]|uniref:DNA-binding protein n=1 Tax=Methylobacterium nodulans (strain LMG 21967 / CNCM I-2342 / ORS 2060) TaxID=460265 RepID=B8IXV0_METNO|nr:hypothetical protein [Methylobacterium nodulans]ACL63240.1 conserved hypothetical protein [Methylobacterium nodulans ORS 2060]